MHLIFTGQRVYPHFYFNLEDSSTLYFCSTVGSPSTFPLFSRMPIFFWMALSARLSISTNSIHWMSLLFYNQGCIIQFSFVESCIAINFQFLFISHILGPRSKAFFFTRLEDPVHGDSTAWVVCTGAGWWSLTWAFACCHWANIDTLLFEWLIRFIIRCCVDKFNRHFLEGC